MNLDDSLYKKVSIKESDIHGKGVFANEDIDKNIMTLVAVLKNRSFFIGKIFRYVNHSYTPNIVILRKGNYVYVKTIKKIKKGDELTANYDDSNFLMSYNQTKNVEYDELVDIKKVKTNIPFLIFKINPKDKLRTFE